ncbi:MAG: nucleotidyltransferase domain-containing protein [Clostridia bacterium]|nr:nucleotidyltransferase domain-containing protein [Clostridia bacterium]
MQYKKLLNEFAGDLNESCGVEILDLVLYGSTMTGDFVQGRGDIDFLVFLNETLSEEQQVKIFNLHERYRQRKDLFKQLEGTYYFINQKHVDGIYIGSTRKGWKNINQVIHGPIEQGMILSCYEAFRNKVTLESFFATKWAEIYSEIDQLTQRFFTQKKEITDLDFIVYAIQTTTRSIYTIREKAFTSKTNAINYVLKLNLSDSNKLILEKLKTLRYPLQEQEKVVLEQFDLDNLLDELLMMTKNYYSTESMKTLNLSIMS